MRLGLHANDTSNHAAILDYYDRSGAKVFKTLVFHAPLLGALKARDVTIIGRVYTDTQRLGGQVAKDFLKNLVETAKRHPQVDYWEGYNEEFAGPDDIGRYAEFEIERMQALEAIGRKAIIGCFSCGTPALPDDADPNKAQSWARFMPAIAHAHRSKRHALGLHEYSGPYMQYFTETPDGHNQWKSNRWTGISANSNFYWLKNLTGHLTLRYRKVYAQALAAAGYGDLPLFITEGGLDDTTPRPGPHGKGYKAFQQGGWDSLDGIGDYAEQLFWYFWQISHDTYVKGATDFGWEGTRTGWPDFDLSTDAAMLNRIIDKMKRDLPVGHFGATTPAPTPVPPVVTPAPTPIPPVSPPGPIPAPIPNQFSQVLGIPITGEGWAAFAGRVAGHPLARYAHRLTWAREIAAANGEPIDPLPALRTGSPYVLPWFKAVPK